MSASDAGPAAVSADVIWTVRHCDAIADALLREIGRLARGVASMDIATRDRTALAMADAQAIRDRVHGLRRHLEELGLEAAP